MHRIASLPSEDPSENLALIEQPSASVLILSSARSDISSLASTLQGTYKNQWSQKIRALPLECLSHKAQIDHYLSTTARNAKLILIRLLGGKGHWSYGLEQLKYWQEEDESRNLIILSGTKEHEVELNGLSNIEYKITESLGELFRAGGQKNFRQILKIIDLIISGNYVDITKININRLADPYIWDWREEQGDKIGVILYSSYLQSGNTDIAETINQELRAMNLVPRLLWVSSLKSQLVQSKVIKLFKNESVECILTATSFSTIDFNETYEGSVIWDTLKKPVFQILSSSRTKQAWKSSSRGLAPIDFSLQVVLPELDGRVTTRVGAFREQKEENYELSTTIEKYVPNKEGIKWIVNHIKSWINLASKRNRDKKVSIILANYPYKDGRIANGVGLDTPESLFNVIQWLKGWGYELGESIPNDSRDLMKDILKKRTNSYESMNNEPVDYLTIEEYKNWYLNLPKTVRDEIERRWGKPEVNDQLEKSGFAINGIKYGNISILVQQSRGQTFDNLNDVHSGDLPPPHKYLAQYVWISNNFKSDCIIQFGKHGTVEWLPGKSVALSPNCFPSISLPPIPNIYPFIVNDPGEGSQAKRRTHSVIIDHLTPPLGRAGLYGDLTKIESLIDEYHESVFISKKRSEYLQTSIESLLSKNMLSNLVDLEFEEQLSENSFDQKLNTIDSYLCEIKESQIRTGLHVFGTDNDFKKNVELALSITLVPRLNQKGLSQLITDFLHLRFDPWKDEITHMLSERDKNILSKITTKSPRNVGDAISIVNNIAEIIVSKIVDKDIQISESENITKEQIKIANHYLNYKDNYEAIDNIKKKILKKLIISPKNEKDSLRTALNGGRISGGPSGAPTRGKPEVLPTGRNFFSVDLRGIPSETAWDLGRRSAQQILDLYLQENGEDLKTLGLSVWGTSTMRNGGEDIAQLLALIGVQPIWEFSTGRVIDIEVIPYSILQRPRVDVTLRISGLFRDAFPQLITLVNKAQNLVSQMDEPGEINPLAEGLARDGSTARIFGSAPETYGTGLQELINTGNWDDKHDLGNTYINWSSWVYEDSENAVQNTSLLKKRLHNMQVVIHNQDNREHDILDSDDYYQFHGGLSSAVETVSGQKPRIYYADNSNYTKPKVYKLEREIDKVVRSRLLNPKWVEGMMNHKYKGAFEMSASIDYLFAYDATTNSVPNWVYSSIIDKWLDNKEIISFLKKENPWALRDISERLKEASNRQLWENASKDELSKLNKIILNAEKDIEENKYQTRNL